MENFKHKKSLGQNFLTDKNLLAAIVSDAGITECDTVIEVGAGQGALTVPLLQTGARVFSYEIDGRLIPALKSLEKEYPNLTIVDKDILSEDIADIESKMFSMPEIPAPEIPAPENKLPYKVVANLPYYITTPILFMFIEGGASSITVMVQKEVAERIAARSGGKDYGVLSVMCQLCSKPIITRKVGRNMFNPQPNVDSAVVRLDITGRIDPRVRRLVRAAFSMRRKTLTNCLSGSYGKEKVLSALSAMSLEPNVRGECLSPSEFIQLTNLLNNDSIK